MNEAKARFFDAQADAAWADAEYTGAELEKIEWLFEQVGLAEGQLVLEPGCGSGRVTLMLGSRVKNHGGVLACDISPAMIAKAQARCRELPGVTVLHAGIEDLELQPAAFDLTLCFNFFPHGDDKTKILALLADALKPGGLCAIFHLEPSAVINDLHRKAGTVVERDMIPGQREIEAMFRAAGLAPLSFRDDDRFFALARK